MGFLQYLLIGAIAYGSGWAIQHYLLKPSFSTDLNSLNNTDYGLNHPKIITYLTIFFVIMLAVSILIDLLILKNGSMDLLFVLVNSTVATFVFSFGLLPDKNKHEVPK